ncbi:MAG: response regulator [Lachnospiraceae bacterium]|nr:response regulator [Lachnospiraceae bacterium]
MNRILIAESDTGLAHRLREAFVDGNSYAMSCDTIKQTRTMLECEDWSLVLIDEKMMDGSGFQLLEEIEDDTIVMMILNENTAPNLERFYEYKIVDFINKPFNPIVLKAKVYTQIEKKNAEVKVGSSACFDALGVAAPEFMLGDKVVYIDKYEFDFENKQYKYEGSSVMLDELEQKLLQLLVENRGVVLKKNTLLERLQMGSREKMDCGMLAEIAQILIEKLHAFKYIKVIFGVGYMWATQGEG